MLGTGLLRRLGRRLAARVATRVAEDELFEKPRERPPQPAIFPTPAAPAPAPAAAPAPSPRAVQAEAGCTPVDLAALRARLGPGGGLRVVNHWATWCDPCVEELPVLAQLHADLGAQVVFLGVSWDLFEGGSPAATAREVARFADEYGIGYPSLLVHADPEDFFAALDITVFQKIPQTWVVDDGGAVVHRIEGVLDAAGAAALADLLRARLAG